MWGGGGLLLRKTGFSLEAKVIQELRHWQAGWLEIPCLIKNCMMAQFDDAQRGVKVHDILVCCGVPQKNAGEVMSIQLTAAGAGALDAYPRAKHFEVCDIGLANVPTFEWSLAGSQVDKLAVQVDGVEQGGRPKLYWEARPIEKGADFDSQCVVINFCTAVLGRAAGAHSFNHVVEFLQHSGSKLVASGKFAALFGPNVTIAQTKLFHKSTEDGKREIF